MYGNSQQQGGGGGTAACPTQSIGHPYVAYTDLWYVDGADMTVIIEDSPGYWQRQAHERRR